MKLFTLGPVEMYPYTRELLEKPLPYFRTQSFSNVVLECAERIRRLTGAPNDAHVYLLTCSGTGAMEVAAADFFTGEDKALVIDGGGFGHRFALICEHHGIGHEVLKIPFGETPQADMFEGYKDGNIDAVFVNHHETSVGRLYDLDVISEFCRRKNAYLIVDAIASFLADPIDFEGQGIDALIISSQKALALPPGLAILVISDRLYRRTIERDIKPFSMYFDIKEAESNAVRGQTPFTPAVGTILALSDRLAHIESEGGCSAAVNKTRDLAEYFRSLLKEKNIPAILPAHPLSNASTPILFPDGGAREVYRRLSEEYDIWLNPNGGDFADKLLRVGHIGNLEREDFDLLAQRLCDILA